LLLECGDFCFAQLVPLLPVKRATEAALVETYTRTPFFSVDRAVNLLPLFIINLHIVFFAAVLLNFRHDFRAMPMRYNGSRQPSS